MFVYLWVNVCIHTYTYVRESKCSKIITIVAFRWRAFGFLSFYLNFSVGLTNFKMKRKKYLFGIKCKLSYWNPGVALAFKAITQQTWSRASQIEMYVWISGDLVKMKILTQEVWVSLRLCISNDLPGDVDVADLRSDFEQQGLGTLLYYYFLNCVIKMKIVHC